VTPASENLEADFSKPVVWISSIRR
jgi:hypothetical protein